MHTSWNTYRKFLFPLSLIYGFIIWIRNWLFDVSILKSKSYFTPTINVGNIAIGGTGKTPHIEYLIELLSSDYKISTLSRGYKRKTKGFLIAKSKHSFEDIGDEPKQLKYQFKDIIVSVDGNRQRGIEYLENLEVKPDVILLDDAFQHRHVNPGINILLTDYSSPYWEDCILPVGNLRDSPSQVRRADIVIVSKTPESITPIIKRIIIKKLNLFPYQELFFTSIVYGDLECITNPISFIEEDCTVLMLTGIANPIHLEQHLDEKYKKVIKLEFPDHHSFTESDFDKVIIQFNNISSENKIIVTTLKDAVRLKDNRNFEKFLEIPIFYQAMKIDFLGEDDKNKFNKLMFKYVKNAKRDRKVY